MMWLVERRLSLLVGLEEVRRYEDRSDRLGSPAVESGLVGQVGREFECDAELRVAAGERAESVPPAPRVPLAVALDCCVDCALR